MCSLLVYQVRQKVIVQEQVKVIPTFDLKKHPCVRFDEKQEPLLLCVAQTEVTE